MAMSANGGSAHRHGEEEEAAMRFATLAIHGGQRPDPTTGAIMPPISVSSTYVQVWGGVPVCARALAGRRRVIWAAAPRADDAAR